MVGIVSSALLTAKSVNHTLVSVGILSDNHKYSLDKFIQRIYRYACKKELQ